MPRKLRVQYPGAIYHLMNRGDRREDIFEDDTDRHRFLDTLGQTCDKTGWQVHAYCLMSNHFHLVIETPQPNLVPGMKWLLGTYTSRFNRRHREFGHVFSKKGSVITIDTEIGLGYPFCMPRKLRVQYPGAIYHLMNRGDRREDIFEDDTDRHRFLDTLGQTCDKTGWQVHAYCLMSNHFHLVIETPQPNLVPGMKWLLGTYTSRFNRRHREFGHVFSGRYKSLIVDGSGNGYLKSVCDYVHLNPVRAELLRPKEPLECYVWSSYGEYLKARAKRFCWLRVDRLLGEWGIPKDSPAGRKRFAQCIEHRRLQENPKTDWKAVERGWFLGDPEFKAELLAQMHGRRGAHYGLELREADEVHAERVLREELRRRGWAEAELSRRRKGDPQKVEMASQLRSRTSMTLKWIARRLQMGAWTYLSNCLGQKRKEEGEKCQ